MFERRTRKPARKMPSGDNKPRLAAWRVPVFKVEYKEFERFVEAVFGFEFDFLFAAGISNGTGVEYKVVGELQTFSWKQKAEELRQGRRTKDVALILSVLAHDNYIPPGHYTIIA
jgi:hypothetical protein